MNCQYMCLTPSKVRSLQISCEVSCCCSLWSHRFCHECFHLHYHTLQYRSSAGLHFGHLHFLAKVPQGKPCSILSVLNFHADYKFSPFWLVNEIWLRQAFDPLLFEVFSFTLEGRGTKVVNWRAFISEFRFCFTVMKYDFLVSSSAGHQNIPCTKKKIADLF